MYQLLQLQCAVVLAGQYVTAAVQECRDHLQISRCQKADMRQVPTEDPELQIDMWTLLLLDNLCLVPVNWYTF
jgi:hypothetical protein